MVLKDFIMPFAVAFLTPENFTSVYSASSAAGAAFGAGAAGAGAGAVAAGAGAGALAAYFFTSTSMTLP